MRKITIILSLLFLAVAFGVAAAQSPRQLRYYCFPGFKYCPTVMQCVPLDYPCPNRARRVR
jgi:hypothetical protein